MLAETLLALVPVSCVTAAPQEDAIVIGSKNFTESRLLGELLAILVAERTELAVEHRSGLGGTLVCFEALTHGAIDLYPEYTGTAWSIVLEEPERVSDPLRTYLHVQAAYRRRYDLEWLQPFGLDNTYALAMPEAAAEELGIRTISDLVEHGSELSAGFSIEFMNREDGYPGLAPYYGLELREVRAMEHGLAYDAVAAGSIDLLDAYATDGKLLRFDLRILEDDRGFFPPYHAAPIVRGELLRARPELREALDLLAFRLPDRRMMELNHAVEVEGRGFREVALGFLREEGLLDERDGETGRSVASSGGRRIGLRETGRLAWEHVRMTAAGVLLAALLAVPLGIAITRNASAGRVGLAAAGVLQTVPSLALLAFLIAVPGLGLSVRSAVLALFLYALLPILRNTYTGIREVDPALLDAARGMGLTPRQMLLRIQLPLATRTIMAGIRTAAVISIGVATLAAFIGAGGLGEPIVTGLYLNDVGLILGGAIPAALLALLADFVLGLVERWITPRGLRIARRGR